MSSYRFIIKSNHEFKAEVVDALKKVPGTLDVTNTVSVWYIWETTQENPSKMLDDLKNSGKINDWAKDAPL